MKKYKNFTVAPEHKGLTVEQYIVAVLQYSRRSVQRLTRQKGIQLNSAPAFLKRPVKTGDIIKIRISDDTVAIVAEKGGIDILYEDSRLFVINKPPYQLVHPAGRTASGTTANYLAGYCQEKGLGITVRPIHRLDRNTSGCVLFAADAHTQYLLEEQMKQNCLHRIYQALVKGILPADKGTFDMPIGPHPSQPNRRWVCQNGERAITHYRVLEIYGRFSLVELTLETGRTHQIRVHLAAAGYPVVGDAMYGEPSRLIARQALHAAAITFHHPDNKKITTVKAPLPTDFSQALTAVSRAASCSEMELPFQSS